MAVRLDNQRSSFFGPLLFLLFLILAGGAWYYLKYLRPKPEIPVVAKAPPKPEGPSEFVPPPPPPPPPPVVDKGPVFDDSLPEAPPPPPSPIDPEVEYSIPKGAHLVKPRTGKGPSDLDKEMWAFMASPDKPHKWGLKGGLPWLPKIDKYLSRTAKEMVAHPGAKDFPGPVAAEAPRITKAIKVPLRIHGWFSTGLYAPPGEIIRIQASSELMGKSDVVIGCHRDNIAGSKRVETHRFPVISITRRIDKSSIEVANPFGGLIYIVVPDNPQRAKSNATCRVEISGAVEAPLFVLGETTKEEWMRVRRAPAPWGELGGKSHFGAARSGRFRNMSYEYAKDLAEYWDKAVDLQDWMCGWGERRCPERMVPDAEISAGSGHSGYPYMGYLDWEGWVDLENIRKNGSWGHYHEIGHNHQSSSWTFQGYGEVTNNVLGLLCEDRLVGIKVGEGGGWLGDYRQALSERLGIPPVESARGNLAMYVPVIKAFGWESLRATFAEYTRRTARTSMRLETDERKKETFVRLWSRFAKANLGPYFETFGFPYTSSMRTSLSGYKKWMPPDFPPKPAINSGPKDDIPDHGAVIGDYQE